MVSAAALVDLIGPWADGADPLNEQLADALTRAIEVGLLPPGTRLPAERELARELALSRTTIVAAYDRLRLAGLARSRQGSGTRVAARRPGLLALRADAGGGDRHRAAGPVSVALPPASRSGRAARSTPVAADAIQFTIGALPAGPAVADVRRRPPCARTCPALLGETGLRPVRAAAAARSRSPATSTGSASRPTPTRSSSPTARSRPSTSSPRRSAGRAARSSSRTRPTSVPSTPSGRPATGCLPMPVDADGPRVEVVGLLAASAPVRLAYVVPTFHNPTGVTMPEARRRELAAAAAASSASRSSRT